MTCGLRYALRIATCGNALDSVFHAGKSKILPQLAKVGTTMEFEMRCFYSGDDKSVFLLGNQNMFIFWTTYILRSISHDKVYLKKSISFSSFV